MRVKYKEVSIDIATTSVEEKLNEYGKCGWMLKAFVKIGLKDTQYLAILEMEAY